ncbi:MAG: hypothetical protein CMA08_01415 [Euryarchaeota archaeon]|nr:hypothetical protein [Euryarchaeota archaeon]OUX22808.1 MAG: hypothetical protein CBE12_01270 [Euryarchaeota archaeon TMED252]|tara:strand:- start:133 stop:438 length:306 start_codon:yes stop_codon:yes gene_type:complete
MDDHVHVRIRGHSMWPTYTDGQTVTFRLTKDASALTAGSVVLAQHPLKADVKVVKRIRHVEDDGRFFLEGDHPDPLGSEDSHNFGSVKPAAILAVADEDEA